MSKNSKTREITIFMVLLATSFFTSCYFDSFPFGNSAWSGTDSSVFMYIGKGMHSGKVPYKDMFDHKGIILYFIEFLATFVEGFAGIYIMELASTFLATFFIYKTVRLVTEDLCIRLLVSLLLMYFFGRPVYEGGNLTELYALPCVAYANYIFLKYLSTSEYSFMEFFLIGVTFSIVLLLRVNMVAPWAFYAVYILALSLAKGRGGDLIKMIASAACGVLAVLIPVLLYLLVTDSLHDMIESYILFNLKYIGSPKYMSAIGKPWRSRILAAVEFIRVFIAPYICMILASAQQKEERKPFAINTLAFIATLFFVCVSGRAFKHYAIILLPFFVLPVSHVLSILKKDCTNFLGRPATFFSILPLLLAAGFLLADFAVSIRLRNREILESEVVAFLKENTAKEDDVLVLGNSVYYNILAGRTTRQRFFYQLPIIGSNQRYLDEFKASLRASPPDCIVLPLRDKDSEEFDDELFGFMEANYRKETLASAVIYLKS